MTVRAYVLIETKIGTSREVAEALRRVPDIVTVDVITGPYDVVAIIDAPSAQEVNQIVTGEVHRAVGITRTVTCLSVTLPR